MIQRIIAYIRTSDWVLLAATFFLVAMGLMALYSIDDGVDNADFANFKKQLIFFCIGIVLLLFFMVLDYRYLRNYSTIIYAIGVILLVAVLVFGTTVRGTKGWILLFGNQGFQPVELVKIIMIIMMSALLARWRAVIHEVRQLGIYFLVGGALIALVLLQPDFGSAIILACIFLGLLFIAKIRSSYIIAILLIIIALSVFSWFFVLQEYQIDRIMTFIDPSRDPWGSGYNIKQSIIAVGSGNVFGRGLGLGPQSRLNFLPAQETDFIFAVIAEELGLIGALLLITLFTVVIYRLVRIARMAHDDFARFLISGMILYLVAQTTLNIGMNIGLLPIAGVPLPLVSYGGSSLIATCIIISIAESIHIRHYKRSH